MRYTDINPKLTAEIIKQSGFQFDGYYYVSQLCPARFNFENDGFKPSFEDPSFPRFTKVITTYSELIGLMHSLLQLYLQKQITGKNFPTDRDAQRFIMQKLHDYYAFDKNIDFLVQFSNAGIVPLPNNEYTFSLLDGNIVEFLVNYTNRERVEEPIKFECSPQCISWPFIMELIKEINPDAFVGENPKVSVNEVRMNTPNGYVPFFGVGIPKINKNAKMVEENPTEEPTRGLFNS